MTMQWLGRMAKASWEKKRPHMVEELKARGMYEAALLQAQETALVVYQNLKQEGIEPELAWEIATTEYILLPPESAVPELTPDQMPYLRSRVPFN